MLSAGTRHDASGSVQIVFSVILEVASEGRVGEQVKFRCFLLFSWRRAKIYVLLSRMTACGLVWLYLNPRATAQSTCYARYALDIPAAPVLDFF